MRSPVSRRSANFGRFSRPPPRPHEEGKGIPWAIGFIVSLLALVAAGTWFAVRALHR